MFVRCNKNLFVSRQTTIDGLSFRRQLRFELHVFHSSLGPRLLDWLQKSIRITAFLVCHFVFPTSYSHFTREITLWSQIRCSVCANSNGRDGARVSGMRGSALVRDFYCTYRFNCQYNCGQFDRLLNSIARCDNQWHYTFHLVYLICYVSVFYWNCLDFYVELIPIHFVTVSTRFYL